jgi:SAM-dependent methyltransferase
MSQKIGYKKNWYKEWFGEDYLTVYQHRDYKDAVKLIHLIREHVEIKPDSFLLDLACGNGRHAAHLKCYSQNIFGLDLSDSLLREAIQKKGKEKSPSFVQADMRYFPFNIQFDFIFSLFTSFGYFDKDEKHLKVAQEISEHLLPGGTFVIDYFNAEYVKENLVAYGERSIGDIKVKEKRWLSEKFVHKNIVIYKDEGVKYFQESVRMFELNELRALLKQANIKTCNIFGDYNGSLYSKNSKRMILFAKKV